MPSSGASKKLYYLIRMADHFGSTKLISPNWAGLFGLSYLDYPIWTILFGLSYLDRPVWIDPFGQTKFLRFDFITK